MKRAAPAYFNGFLPLLLLGLLLAGCDGDSGNGQESTATIPPPMGEIQRQSTALPDQVTPSPPQVDLSIAEEDVTIEPLPLRAGFPFTVTATIHNNWDALAKDIPVLIYISAVQEEVGYTPFVQTLTVTLPSSQSLDVKVPVNWNFEGGDTQLWIQVNRLPDEWQPRVATQAEADIDDNIVLLDLTIDPFDAYASDLCSGRTDVEIEPMDVLPEPDHQRVFVRVRNVGNHAVYNLPVIVLGDHLSGIAYTPAIPPCGGTVEMYIEVDRPFQEGESLEVLVNPGDWAGSLEEDDFDNNRVSIVAGLAPGLVVPPGTGLDDYDFSLSSADIEIPQMWIVQVTVHNLGTRDAAMVPIRVENEAGRKINDAIPLVQGNGLGVAAIRAGYLWTRGGTLTFTLNPEDVAGSFPEENRDNNTATFTLP